MTSSNNAGVGGNGKGRLPPSLSAAMKEIDDCDRPACEDTVSALTAALGRVGKKDSSSKQKGAISNTSASKKLACPPNSGLLGKSSWNLVHSMAAWYPDNPSKEDERMMTQFMNAFARFYPCTYCAKDFQENIDSKPVRAKTREELCLWLCEQHNLVNSKLGKKLFECNMKNLDERWRKSNDPRCDSV